MINLLLKIKLIIYIILTNIHLRIIADVITIFQLFHIY